MSSNLEQPLTPHAHEDAPPGASAASRRATNQLTLAMAFCFVFMIAEVVGGYFAGSLAIMTECVRRVQGRACQTAVALTLPSTPPPPPTPQRCPPSL